MKPIEPFQTGNCDMTSMFVWEGTASENQSSNNWARVSTESQAKGERSVTSYYVDSEEVKCNGLTVKWCDGIFASGHLLPSVSIFGGLSETEMPLDTFMVIEVEGMSVNANLDTRNKDLGYIVFLCKNEKMDQFYEWYENNIVYPYFRQLSFQYHQISVQDVGLIPKDLFTRVWLDSDMQQNKRLASLGTMQSNMKKGIYHNKIDAKYTGRMQPCDLGQSFKIMK